MKIIFALILVISAHTQAEIKREVLTNDAVRITFSGKDLKQYDFLKNSNDRARSSIRGLCFTEMERGEFGQPIEIKKCALLLEKGIHFDYFKLDSLNTKAANILKLKELDLVTELKSNLSSKAQVATLQVRIRTRSCTTTNSNPSCYTVYGLRKVNQFLAQVECNLDQEASVVCGASSEDGCFLTATLDQRFPQKISVEEATCGLNVEGEIAEFFEPGQTIERIYQVRERRNRLRLEATTLKSTSNNEFFNLEITELRFYGRDISGSEIKCSNEQVDKGRKLKLTCTNQTNKRIHIGLRGRNGAVFNLRACNFNPNN